MDTYIKQRLLTEIENNNVYLSDKALRSRIYLAINNENIEELMGIMASLVRMVNTQKMQISVLSAEVKSAKDLMMQKENEMRQIQRAKGSMITPPALRGDLDVSKMYELYQIHQSFSKVGKLMGCAGKTVKKRLVNAGFINNHK